MLQGNAATVMEAHVSLTQGAAPVTAGFFTRRQTLYEPGPGKVNVGFATLLLAPVPKVHLMVSPGVYPVVVLLNVYVYPLFT